ncbi:Alcohol oxidase [Cladophialophora carrionii]|uniref:Alcohol oxidase n=1 Tax=Cladophialophora carrionii TaxID=86049 RepID=A0A1C1CGD7_9EURO|nr:Alcohol oxidase [Cladophialophora carrionii]
MGLYTTLPDELAEVDIIIVGGGTAGCVIASRLADTDPQCAILVIEGGPNNLDLPAVAHPALYRGNFMPGSKTIQPYLPRKEEHLSGRTAIVFAASVLGGGSSVNAAMYNRPQRDDLDSWNTEGWSADELLPSLTKFETYHGRGDAACHGASGPIKVSSGTYTSNAMADDFVAAMNKTGFPEVRDLQDLVSANGVSRTYRYVSPDDGRRQNAATAYLHPRLRDGHHPNLHVLVESQVVRVLFDQDKRATAVEYRPNPNIRTEATRDLRRTVKARKLVVISAGTHSTPSILERSGIGSREVLDRAAVPVLCDLPGVGRNYQDHQMTVYTYKSSMRAEDTTESIIDGTRDVAQLLGNNDKFLSWNGVDASAKIRPTESDVDSMGSGFREVWERDFKNAPNRPLGLIFSVAGGRMPKWEMQHITGPDLEDPLDFETGFLSDRDDIDLTTQVWLYKTQRQVARRMRFYRGETHLHPRFPGRSNADSLAEPASDEEAGSEIRYSPEDDEAIRQWVREHIGTAFHSLGTCKMAPVEELGVVDKDLNVHGVHMLKVADLSIVPENVSGNTMSTALMIGEKAADIIIQDLGLACRG